MAVRRVPVLGGAASFERKGQDWDITVIEAAEFLDSSSSAHSFRNDQCRFSWIHFDPLPIKRDAKPLADIRTSL